MKNIWMAFLLVLCFAIPVSAQTDATQDIVDEVISETQALNTPGFNFAETAQKAADGTLTFSFEDCIRRFVGLLTDEVKSNAATLIKMLVLAVLAGILCNLQENLPTGGVNEISFLACFALIAGLSVTIIAEILETANNTIDTILVLIAGLMPTMAGLTVSTSAAAMAGFYPTLFIAMQSFVAICKNIFLPLIMVITSLSVINAISGRFQVSRLIEFARQVIKWGLGLLLTVFVGILNIHCFTAKAAGTVAGRTVKYALCNFIPMVGNVLAESAEAVISSIRILRGALGISGILAVVSLCVLPIVKILATSVLYRFAAAIAEPATDKRIIQLLMDLAGNITLAFAILLMVAVMFIISIALLCMLLV